MVPPFDYAKFTGLTYDQYRQRAQDPSLSVHEKVGFPDQLREGKEEAIFADICAALPALLSQGKCVVEIGPGCARLPRLLMELCAEQQHSLVFVDCEEMLKLLPDVPFLQKVVGPFPACERELADLKGKADVVIAYSLLPPVVLDSNPFDFVDASLELLAPGGAFLLGDIPNRSKARRFFSSERGVQFHKQFMQTEEPPEVRFNRIERHEVDDSIVLGLVQRARNAGFDAYIRPQHPDLPLANRREDILIFRP